MCGIGIFTYMYKDDRHNTCSQRGCLTIAVSQSLYAFSKQSRQELSVYGRKQVQTMEHLIREFDEFATIRHNEEKRYQSTVKRCFDDIFLFQQANANSSNSRKI